MYLGVDGERLTERGYFVGEQWNDEMLAILEAGFKDELQEGRLLKIETARSVQRTLEKKGFVVSVGAVRCRAQRLKTAKTAKTAKNAH